MANIVMAYFDSLTFLGILIITVIIVAVIVKVVWPIIFPTIWTYPWPNSSGNEEDKKKIVLMAGSFNPPHLGHLEMIRFLASRYGEVIVVVGHNANKKYSVTPHERADLLRKCLAMGNDNRFKNVSVLTVSGYIWQHVPQAQLFFRGIRSWEKDGKEESVLQVLNTWGPIVFGPLWLPRTTYFLQGNPKYNHISSTLIREICRDSSYIIVSTEEKSKDCIELLRELVPESIALQVCELYSNSLHD